MFSYALSKNSREVSRATRILPLLLSRSHSDASKFPPVFELRNYEVPPGKLGDVINNATKRVKLEVEMGAMLRGFWATEGFLKEGLITTELFALWEYGEGHGTVDHVSTISMHKRQIPYIPATMNI